MKCLSHSLAGYRPGVNADALTLSFRSAMASLLRSLAACTSVGFLAGRWKRKVPISMALTPREVGQSAARPELHSIFSGFPYSDVLP